MSEPPSQLKEYNILAPLSHGGFGRVYVATKKGTNEKRAIKIIQLKSSSLRSNCFMEVAMLAVVEHKHVVKMYEYFLDQTEFYIVMEYCKMGTVGDWLKARGSFPENLCQEILKQLALALEHMRKRNVSHLDLKPTNLMLCGNYELFTLKVGDFGLALKLKLDEVVHKVRGSSFYMAPEILLDESFGPNADLWSVGVILYECLYGKTPYASASSQEFEQRLRLGYISFPAEPELSENCCLMLNGLLERNPKLRIPFKDFFVHPFLYPENALSNEDFVKKKHDEMSSTGLAKAQDSQEGTHAGEPDSVEKDDLQRTSYEQRVEELKKVIHGNDKHPGIRAIMIGLDFGYQGDDYVKHKKLDRALEEYTAALKILVPMLDLDIPESIKTHLSTQVTYWEETAKTLN